MLEFPTIFTLTFFLILFLLPAPSCASSMHQIFFHRKYENEKFEGLFIVKPGHQNILYFQYFFGIKKSSAIYEGAVKIADIKIGKEGSFHLINQGVQDRRLIISVQYSLGSQFAIITAQKSSQRPYHVQTDYFQASIPDQLPCTAVWIKKDVTSHKIQLQSQSNSKLLVIDPEQNKNFLVDLKGNKNIKINTFLSNDSLSFSISMVCAFVCGNGVLQIWEECDQGGVGGACVDCKLSPGYRCPGDIGQGSKCQQQSKKQNQMLRWTIQKIYEFVSQILEQIWEMADNRYQK